MKRFQVSPWKKGTSERSFLALLTLSAAIAALFQFGATAQQIATVPGFGPYQIGSGGEFTIQVNDPSIWALLGNYSPSTINQGGYANSFQTFCVERNEYITPDTGFDVTTNALNETIYSGVQLPVGAAYLYQQFATGQLNYNYADSPAGDRTAGGFDNAYYLQLAIWYYMGDYTAQPGNPYEQLVSSLFGAGAFAPDNGAHNVLVLNLWAPNEPHDPAHAYQDLLIYTGQVPEPTVLALAGMGVAVGLLSRRRK